MNDDPFGDNDPLVQEARERLLHYLRYAPDNHHDILASIDDLIQVRIAVTLESLTDAALGKKTKTEAKA